MATLNEIEVAEDVIVQQIFKANVSQVWKALTQPVTLRRWFYEIPGFKARSGTSFQFKGFGFQNKGTVVEAIPGHKLRLALSSGKGYESLVTYELMQEQENVTILRVIHEGLDRFPGELISNYVRFMEQWQQLVRNNLRDLLKKT